MSLVIDVKIAENAPILFFEPPLTSRFGFGDIPHTPHSTADDHYDAQHDQHDDMSVDSSTNFSEENQSEENQSEENQVVPSMFDNPFENQFEGIIKNITGKSYKTDFPNCEFLSVEEHFQILKHCACCQDHQIDKPSILGEVVSAHAKRAFDQKIGGSGRVEDGVCDCDCRHLSRHLSREYN